MLGSQACTTMPGLCNAGVQQNPVHARQVLYQLKHSTRPSQSSFFTCFIYVGRYAVRHHAPTMHMDSVLSCHRNALYNSVIRLGPQVPFPSKPSRQLCLPTLKFLYRSPSNVVYRVHAAPPASSSFSLLRCRAAQEAPRQQPPPPVNLRKYFRSL